MHEEDEEVGEDGGFKMDDELEPPEGMELGDDFGLDDDPEDHYH